MELVWQIDWMKCLKQTEGLTDFVIECGWRATAQEDTAMAQAYGSVSFPAPQNADGSFTPYDQLTQDQVLGWVWASGVDKAEVDASLTAQVQAQLNPEVVTKPLPWQA